MWRHFGFKVCSMFCYMIQCELIIQILQKSCSSVQNGPIKPSQHVQNHYGDVIMGTIASQITSLTIYYSIVYSGADQKKHQSSASLAFLAQMSSNPENVSIWWRHHMWLDVFIRNISRAKTVSQNLRNKLINCLCLNVSGKFNRYSKGNISLIFLFMIRAPARRHYITMTS